MGAVVLAAGRSSRMGTPKQLLPLGSATVLERTLGNVRSSALNEIVLVLGASADSICRQLPQTLLEDIRVVVNDTYEEGMASSLRTGLSAVSPQTDAVLVVLADQPFVQPHTFDRIADEYRRGKAQIVIPTYQGRRGNPVLLNRSLFPEAMALEGDVGCRAIFGNYSQEIVRVEVPDPGILLDLDSKDDYERLQSFGESGKS